MLKVGSAILVVGCFLGLARAQEYSIDRPADPSSTPVHLTAPVAGRVEVAPGRDPLRVRVVGGRIEGPLQVEGTVGLRTDAVVPVEVTNPAPWPERVSVDGTVRVEDDRPVRVWVANLPEAAAPQPASGGEGRFAAFVARGAFEARQTRIRTRFLPPDGQVFEAYGIAVDTRRDVDLRVRLLAEAGAVGGVVSGASAGPVPFALIERGARSPVALPVPVPLAGPFLVDVESPGPGQGAPFTVVVTGKVKGER